MTIKRLYNICTEDTRHYLILIPVHTIWIWPPCPVYFRYLNGHIHILCKKGSDGLVYGIMPRHMWKDMEMLWIGGRESEDSQIVSRNLWIDPPPKKKNDFRCLLGPVPRFHQVWMRCKSHFFSKAWSRCDTSEIPVEWNCYVECFWKAEIKTRHF